MKRVEPPGSAKDEPLAKVIAPILGRFVDETRRFFAGGLDLGGE